MGDDLTEQSMKIEKIKPVVKYMYQQEKENTNIKTITN